jgi:hypothetical protein
MLTRRQLLGGLLGCIPLMGMTKSNIYYINRKLYGREELRKIVSSEDLISVIEFKEHFFYTYPKIYGSGYTYYQYFRPNEYFQICETSFNRDDKLKIISVNYTLSNKNKWRSKEFCKITIPISIEVEYKLVTKKEFDDFNLRGIELLGKNNGKI